MDRLFVLFENLVGLFLEVEKHINKNINEYLQTIENLSQAYCNFCEIDQFECRSFNVNYYGSKNSE